MSTSSPWRLTAPTSAISGDQVLGLGTIHATGKGSGAETKLTFATVATFRNGRMTHYIDFGDRDQALEAVGLSE